MRVKNPHKRSSKLSKTKGLIKLIVLIVIAVLILSYFGISVRKIATSPTGQDNFSLLWEVALKIWSGIKYVWSNYLAKPALWLWNDVIWANLKPLVIDKLK